jgi:hypothetical protein
MPRKKAAPAAKPVLREPTEAEHAAGVAALAAQARRPARPSLAIGHKGDGMTIGNPHTDWRGWNAQIGEAFGSASEDSAHQAFGRLGAIAREKTEPISEGRANAMLALMSAIAPRDELEAAIGEQIVAAHLASMEFLSRAKMNAGEYRDTAVAYVNAATKLSRTMAVQVETLAKLRGGGRQRIEVIHVNGPASFGDGAQIYAPWGGGERPGNPDQCHAPAQLAHIAPAPGVPMRGQDPEGHALPIAGREEPEAVPDARRNEPRGPEGRSERPLHGRALDAGDAGGEGACKGVDRRREGAE